MPRTEVYQLRLTPEEKGRLARKAEAEHLSIAQMIRLDYGLTSIAYTKDSGKTTAALGLDVLTQRFKNQGYTTPVAERLAHKQLGA